MGGILIRGGDAQCKWRYKFEKTILAASALESTSPLGGWTFLVQLGS